MTSYEPAKKQLAPSNKIPSLPKLAGAFIRYRNSRRFWQFHGQLRDERRVPIPQPSRSRVCPQTRAVKDRTLSQSPEVPPYRQ
jgi:hypothetical protein